MKFKYFQTKILIYKQIVILFIFELSLLVKW